MYDYLNEVLYFYGRKNRDGGTYRAAKQIKAQGDVYLFNKLCREWASRFVWDTPNEVMGSLIEKTILTTGACGIYRDKNGEIKTARATGLAGLNYYGMPNKCTLVDYSGKVIGTFLPQQGVEPDGISNCVLIYDNYLGDKPMMSVMYYYQRLSQISASLWGGLQNILGTQMIHAPREAMKDIERQREAARLGVPYVISYDQMYDANSPQIEILASPPPTESVKLLQESFEKTHHDYLVSIGIYANTEIDKQSGVSDLEISTNIEKTDTILETAKASRDIAVKQLNAIGITDISYKPAKFLSQVKQTSEKRNGEQDKKEGINDENME